MSSWSKWHVSWALDNSLFPYFWHPLRLRLGKHQFLMATSIENFVIAGIVLGVLTAILSLIATCVGAKALKDYILDCLNEMRWHSSFGSARYKWLLDETMKSSNRVGSSEWGERIDTIMRKVVSTWNPHTDESNLEFLHKAIALRPDGTEIFSVELICHCVALIGIDIENFRAWEIIELMLARRKSIASAGIFSEGIRRQSMVILCDGIKKLMASIPPVKVDFLIKIEHNEKLNTKHVINEIKKISRRMQTEMKNQLRQLSTILCMSRLWSILKESFPLDAPTTLFDDRTKTIIYLLDERTSRVVLNQFSNHTVEKKFIDEALTLNQPAITGVMTWQVIFEI
jgi:hypothetical protein